MPLAYLLLLLLSLLAPALPSSNDINKDLTSANNLTPRQLILANPSVRCCTNCAARYSTATFQAIFHDLCTWAGGRLQFSSPQTYYSGNYYCPSPTDRSACVLIELRYLCTATPAAQVTYDGCMGYFDFVINPPSTCGGEPFPGARVRSAGGCWVFQATANDLSDFRNGDSDVGLKCDASGRWCTLPGSNATVNTYTGAAHTFGNAIQL